MNYVDASNIDKALEVTRLEGLVDPDSFDVYTKLAAVNENRFSAFCLVPRHPPPPSFLLGAPPHYTSPSSSSSSSFCTPPS